MNWVWPTSTSGIISRTAGSFSTANKRLQKLKEIVAPDDTDVDLDKKMISVVVKGDHPEWFSIVRTLYHGFISAGNGNDIDLDNPPRPYGSNWKSSNWTKLFGE